MCIRTVVGAIGRLLIAFGVLVLLFVVYLLWGTSLFEASHQDALRRQFSHELAAIAGTRPPEPSQPRHSTTTSTIPLSGVQEAAPGDVPAEGNPVGILVIPRIGLNSVIVEGTRTGDLRLGPGHYPGTPLPGQPGNAAIAGHRTTYGAPFYDLNELRPGDPIFVTTTQGRFEYKVNQQSVVGPADVSVLTSTATTGNELTLTTCTPRFSATQRLVVHATLLNPTNSPYPPQVERMPKQGEVRAGGLAGGQGAWGGAVGWGLAFVAGCVLIWLAARTRRRRWPLYSLGSPFLLVVLYFFFASVSPLLPASF